MRALKDETASPADEDVRRHLDLCLGCRACEIACPSGVPYGRMIDAARHDLNECRPVLQQTGRRELLRALSSPGRLRTTLNLSRITGGPPAPLMRMLQGDSSETPSQSTYVVPNRSEPYGPVVKAVGARRSRVGMLRGCAMRVLYDQVNADTAAILAANGVEVLVNQTQGCCGALHSHNGYSDEARELARGLLDAFDPIDGLDAIVVNSAGCGSAMKEYASLLHDDAEYADRAKQFSIKCKDITEYLHELGWNAPLKSMPIRATYHDACHLVHAQRIVYQPRALLNLIPDIELVPLAEVDVCCGSAGIYNVIEPDMARRLQQRKLENIRATGAAVLITGNPGCMAWIGQGADDQLEVLHPATILRRALASDPVLTS